MDFSSLLSGLGGGGFSPSSSTGQSVPFYNESGIYFDSPGSGTISGNASSADPVTPRALAGGTNAHPETTLQGYAPTPVTTNSNSFFLLIFGGLLALGIGVYFLFKK